MKSVFEAYKRIVARPGGDPPDILAKSQDSCTLDDHLFMTSTAHRIKQAGERQALAPC